MCVCVCVCVRVCMYVCACADVSPHICCVYEYISIAVAEYVWLLMQLADTLSCTRSEPWLHANLLQAEKRLARKADTLGLD